MLSGLGRLIRRWRDRERQRQIDEAPLHDEAARLREKVETQKWAAVDPNMPPITRKTDW